MKILPDERQVLNGVDADYDEEPEQQNDSRALPPRQ